MTEDDCGERPALEQRRIHDGGDRRIYCERLKSVQHKGRVREARGVGEAFGDDFDRAREPVVESAVVRGVFGDRVEDGR